MIPLEDNDEFNVEINYARIAWWTLAVILVIICLIFLPFIIGGDAAQEFINGWDSQRKPF
jgi:hypothetical protein